MKLDTFIAVRKGWIKWNRYNELIFEISRQVETAASLPGKVMCLQINGQKISLIHLIRKTPASAWSFWTTIDASLYVVFILIRNFWSRQWRLSTRLRVRWNTILKSIEDVARLSALRYPSFSNPLKRYRRIELMYELQEDLKVITGMELFRCNQLACTKANGLV